MGSTQSLLLQKMPSKAPLRSTMSHSFVFFYFLVVLRTSCSCRDEVTNSRDVHGMEDVHADGFQRLFARHVEQAMIGVGCWQDVPSPPPSLCVLREGISVTTLRWMKETPPTTHRLGEHTARPHICLPSSVSLCITDPGLCRSGYDYRYRSKSIAVDSRLWPAHFHIAAEAKSETQPDGAQNPVIFFSNNPKSCDSAFDLSCRY